MAAYEIPNLRFSGEAGGVIARRRFVTVNDQEQIVQATDASVVIGVSSLPAKAGEVAEVYDGIVMVEASAAIPAGSAVDTTADGKAVVAAEGGIAVAMTNAGAAGELLSVKL